MSDTVTSTLPLLTTQVQPLPREGTVGVGRRDDVGGSTDGVVEKVVSRDLNLTGSGPNVGSRRCVDDTCPVY